MPKDQAMKFLNAVYTGKDKYDFFIKDRWKVYIGYDHERKDTNVCFQ